VRFSSQALLLRWSRFWVRVRLVDLFEYKIDTLGREWLYSSWLNYIALRVGVVALKQSESEVSGMLHMCGSLADGQRIAGPVGVIWILKMMIDR